MEQTCTVHVQHCQRLKTFLYKPITDLKKNSKPDCLNITKSFSNCLPFLQTFISLSVGHWLKLQHHQTNTDICKQKLLFHLHKMQTKFQTCQGLTCLPTEFGLKIPSASSKFKNLLPYYHPILIGHACFT